METLPPEIVAWIMDSVATNHDLSNLALCSHALHALVMPHLYTHVFVQADSKCSTEETYWRIRKLGVTLLRNASIASRVRSFTVRDAFSVADQQCEELDGPRPYAPGLECARRRIRSSGAPSTSQMRGEKDDEQIRIEVEYEDAIMESSYTADALVWWSEDVLPPRGSTGAVLALFLPRLTNLERLDLLLYEGFEYEYVAAMFESARFNRRPFDHVPGFPALKHVTLGHCDMVHGSCEYLAPAFGLPSMDTICSYDDFCGGGPDVDRYMRLLEPGSSTVTRLEMKDCITPGSHLVHLIRACKSLKAFGYTRSCPDYPDCEFTISEICSALTPAEGTIEELWLCHNAPDSTSFCLGGSAWRNHLEGISLAEFTKLKFLKIAIGFLFGAVVSQEKDGLPTEEHDTRPAFTTVKLAKNLPASLETLWVTQTKGRVRSLILHLEELLRRSESLPSLRRIVLELECDGYAKRYDFSRLEALARERNVELEKICPKEGLPLGPSSKADMQP